MFSEFRNSASPHAQRVRALSRLILHGRVAARRGSENALSLNDQVRDSSFALLVPCLGGAPGALDCAMDLKT